MRLKYKKIVNLLGYQSVHWSSWDERVSASLILFDFAEGDRSGLPAVPPLLDTTLGLKVIRFFHFVCLLLLILLWGSFCTGHVWL